MPLANTHTCAPFIVTDLLSVLHHWYSAMLGLFVLYKWTLTDFLDLQKFNISTEAESTPNRRHGEKRSRTYQVHCTEVDDSFPQREREKFLRLYPRVMWETAGREMKTDSAFYPICCLFTGDWTDYFESQLSHVWWTSLIFCIYPLTRSACHRFHCKAPAPADFPWLLFEMGLLLLMYCGG